MSDRNVYVEKRKARDPEFAKWEQMRTTNSTPD